MIFDPQLVNRYSLDQLFSYIEDGIVTLEDLIKYGLESQKVDELKIKLHVRSTLKRLEEERKNSSSKNLNLVKTEKSRIAQMQVLGKIDLDSLNQSTRPKRLTKEEHRKEREKIIATMKGERPRIRNNANFDLWERVKSLFRNENSQNEDLCNSAIFAPSKVKKGDYMYIQVYVYKDIDKEQVVVDAQMSDTNAVQRSYTPLNFPIQNGDKITITLNLHGLESSGENSKSFIWQNKLSKCSFFIEVPINYSLQKIMGDVYLSVNNFALGQMSFFSDISDYSDTTDPSIVITKPYKKVFISYSHKDDYTVKAIAEAYRALGVVDYFYDRHSLSPGEVYEEKIYSFIDNCDLFVLCWSKNAEDSEWVLKERKRASDAALCTPPKLRMYPINISPYAAPPLDMIKSFHFEDYERITHLNNYK